MHKPSDTPFCISPATCDKAGHCEHWMRHHEGCEAAHFRRTHYRGLPLTELREKLSGCRANPYSLEQAREVTMLTTEVEERERAFALLGMTV